MLEQFWSAEMSNCFPADAKVASWMDWMHEALKIVAHDPSPSLEKPLMALFSTLTAKALTYSDMSRSRRSVCKLSLRPLVGKLSWYCVFRMCWPAE
jgi:hypothetical protein